MMDMRKVLTEASSSDERLLVTPLEDILGHVRLLTNENKTDQVIECPIGRRNFGRRKDLPHFFRDDGAWFDFAVTLRNDEVIAYSFELRLPDDSPDGPDWVRFDLNPPGHDNDQRGMRSHLHLGSDDDGMSISYPRQCPVQLMKFMVKGLRRTGRARGRKPAALD